MNNIEHIEFVAAWQQKIKDQKSIKWLYITTIISLMILTLMTFGEAILYYQQGAILAIIPLFAMAMVIGIWSANAKNKYDGVIKHFTELTNYLSVCEDADENIDEDSYKHYKQLFKVYETFFMLHYNQDIYLIMEKLEKADTSIHVVELKNLTEKYIEVAKSLH